MYIFKFPQAADFKFTYANLDRYTERGRDYWSRKVGTTVEIVRGYGPHFKVKLYDTVIAVVNSDGSVDIPVTINEYGSQATGHWVAKVLQDNGVGRPVYREKGEYAGVAGKTFRPATV